MKFTMTPSQRKLALTAHVASSVGLLGAVATFLALAVVALTGEDVPAIRASYLAMDVTARLVIVPLAFASLLTGLIQSLGTTWGLFRHYWVLAKFLLTVFATVVLVAKIGLIGHAARLATETVLPRADLEAVGIELAVHAAGGLLVLLVPTVLSIYKPRGLTPYGRRVERRRRTPTFFPPPRGLIIDTALAGRERDSSSITVTLQRAHVIGFVVLVLIAHIIVTHVAGIGVGGH